MNSISNNVSFQIYNNENECIVANSITIFALCLQSYKQVVFIYVSELGIIDKCFAGSNWELYANTCN